MDPRYRKLAVAAVAVASMTGAGMDKAAAQEKTTVVLGTATPGGGFPVYGAAYSSTLNEMDATLSVEPKNTKGSTENIPLIESGGIHIGQATGEVTYEALAGIGRPKADLRIINAMYSNSGMFIVRADGPYRALADAHRDHVHAGLEAQHHRGPRVSHHFQPEELLVEAPRPGEVLAHQRPVREQHGTDDRHLAFLRSELDLAHVPSPSSEVCPLRACISAPPGGSGPAAARRRGC